MSAKLSFSDIVDLFVAKTGQTKKEADVFLRELLDVMSSKVCEDGVVKLKDFGTFKVVNIESRESVDVNTGSKVVIAPHRKISFIPDKTLKEVVNKPFSLFQPELLNDGVNFEQAPLGLIDDEYEPEEENEVESAEGGLEVSDISNLESDCVNQSKTEAAVELESFPDLVEGEKHVSASSQSSPITTEPLVETHPYEPSGEMIEEVVEKKSVKKLWLVAGACFMALLLAGLAFSLFNADEDRAVMPIKAEETKINPEPAPKVHLVVKKDSVESQSKRMKSSSDTIANANTTQKPIQEKQAGTREPVKAKTEIVSQGTTFRTLALKHYGSKEYWVYIYQANKSSVPNPDKLKLGTTVVIPDKGLLGIENNSTASIAKAKQLSEKTLRQLK